MPEITLQVLLWILLAFFVGCILGYVLRLIVHRVEEGTIEENIEPTASVAAEPAPVEHKQRMTLADTDPPHANVAKSQPVLSEITTAGYAAANNQAEIAHTELRPEEAAAKPSQPKGIASPRGGTA